MLCPVPALQSYQSSSRAPSVPPPSQERPGFSDACAGCPGPYRNSCYAGDDAHGDTRGEDIGRRGGWPSWCLAPRRAIPILENFLPNFGPWHEQTLRTGELCGYRPSSSPGRSRLECAACLRPTFGRGLAVGHSCCRAGGYSSRAIAKAAEVCKPSPAPWAPSSLRSWMVRIKIGRCGGYVWLTFHRLMSLPPP